jgi:hypothetical protein
VPRLARRTAAATDSISASVRSATAAGVAAWLGSNGPQLTSLQLRGSSVPRSRLRLQLAWAQLAGLRQLSVERCDVAASSGSITAAIRIMTFFSIVALSYLRTRPTAGWPTS